MGFVDRLPLTFLGNAIWQVALLAGVASGLAKLMRRAPARYQHSLWVVTFILAVALPVLSFITRRGESWFQNTSFVIRAATLTKAERVKSAEQPMKAAQCDRVAVRTAEPARALASVAPLWQALARGWHGPSILLPPGAVYALLACYFLWIGFQSVRLWKACKRTSEIRRRSTQTRIPEATARVFSRYQSEFQLSKVSLRCSSRISGPLTLGFRRPAILIPERLLEPAASDDLNAALCHELAHVRRHDFLLNLLYQLLFLPVSFHPAARLLKRRIDETRELACDEMAANHLRDATAYARSIVSMARQFTAASASSGYTLGVGHADILEERIMKLVNKPSFVSAVTAKVLLFVSCAGLVMASAGAATFALSVAQTDKSVSQTLVRLNGVWHSTFRGKQVFVLSLKDRDGKLQGTLNAPDGVSFDSNGQLTEVKGDPHGEWPIVEWKVEREILSFKVRDSDGEINPFEFKLTGEDTAELTLAAPAGQDAGVTPHLKMTRTQDKSRSDLQGNSLLASSQPAVNSVRVSEGTRIVQAVSGGVAGGIVGGVAGGVVGGVAPGPVGGITGGVGPVIAPNSAGEKSGSISGTVFDPSGARVPGAVVSVLGEQSGTNRGTPVIASPMDAVTNDTGDFSLSNLAPGDYKLEVTKAGFAIYQRRRYSLDPGATAKLDVVLEPGAVMETVDVTAKAAQAVEPGNKAHVPQRIRVGGLVQATKLIHQTKPQYPQEARAKGAQGIVLLRAVISKEGQPIGVKVLGTPDPELANAAAEAVREWRYEPTLLNGQPIEVVTTVAVRFHLEN